MPYCETASYPDFQTKVTSQALVACNLQDRKADTAFPPIEMIRSRGGLGAMLYPSAKRYPGSYASMDDNLAPASNWLEWPNSADEGTARQVVAFGDIALID